MPIRRFKIGLWVVLALLALLAVCLVSPAKDLFNEAFLVQHFDELPLMPLFSLC